MAKLSIVFPDQLCDEIDCIKAINKKEDTILMMEVIEEFTFVKHHKKKIVFLLSAMRHFAAELKDQGYNVYYIDLESEENKKNYSATIKAFLNKYEFEEVFTCYPGDYRLYEELTKLQKSIPLTLLEDSRFFCSVEDHKKYFKGKKHPLMESFYQKLRKESGILMNGSKPIGGKFNFDKENRNPLKQKKQFSYYSESKDSVTKDVIKLVEKKFSSHFGDIEPFFYACERKGAKKALKYFISHHLEDFGDYQDAMLIDEAFLHHSVISLYLNAGLLTAIEVCTEIENAYHSKKIPINSAEGYIRQILGWREFIRGIYWSQMPSYKKLNYFQAKEKLPSFFWDGSKTKMNCLSQVVMMTEKYAYSHHIQRLMITGNFSLLCGLDPAEVCEWYLIVYADAFEWVELPNTLGMSLFGDGGFFATKPYCSSGSYINKMSNFCSKCHYNVKEKIGEKACPFNYLYWNFLIKHQSKLKKNRRLSFAYKHIDKLTNQEKQDITKAAKQFIKKL